MRPYSAHEQLIPSATVVLVRPRQDDRYQVYLTRRSRKSGFMGGLYVFPGGAVDPQDRDYFFWQRFVDLTPDQIERRIGGGLPVPEALTYAVAAIRETAEESGVLLAAAGGEPSGKTAQIRFSGADPRLGAGWFAAQADRSGWQLCLSLLRRWSRWITPVGMSRRFDTRFFLAVVPEGQKCAPDGRETVEGRWTLPEKGLEGNLKGEIPLSPPTVVTLHELLAFKRLSALEEAARSRPWGLPIRPRMLKLDHGAMIVEPWDPEYASDRIEVDLENLETHLAAVGEPFSRIWLRPGRCLPMAITRGVT